jgi:hypothetical protein
VEDGAWSERPDAIFSLHSILERTGNFRLSWKRSCQRLGSDESAAQCGSSSGDDSREALAALSDMAAALRITDTVRAASRGYLQRFRHHYPLIAVSTNVTGQEFDAEDDARWARFFHAIHTEFPDALLLVLNRMDDRSMRPFASYVRIVQDSGFGVVEAISIARQAHAYVGAFDVYGAAAWAAGVRGVYASRGKPGSAETLQPARTDGQAWRSVDSMFEDGVATLAPLLQRYPVRPANEAWMSGRLSADAHGFLKVWDQRDLVVVLNPFDAELAAGASDLEHSLELAARIRRARGDAVVCLLGVVSDKPGLARSGRAALWTAMDFGSSPADYATLARCADAYVGVLDSHGRLAFNSGVPGVYAARGFRVRGNAAEPSAELRATRRLQWLTEQVDDTQFRSCLDDLMANFSRLQSAQ